MSKEMLERLIADFMAYGFPVSIFSWQGGEPTLAGLDFFRDVVELEKRYGLPGQVVGNALQTNGLSVDKNWAEFLAEYKFLVGISLDGPEDIHNFYRPNSWRRVMKAVGVLEKQRVAVNILTVVSKANVQRGREVYRFLRKNGFFYLQFIPCLECNPELEKSVPYSIGSAEYGEFLCQIFDEWAENDVGRVSVRMFDSILSYYSGQDCTYCTFGDRCDSYLVVEFNGDIYPCDFYVYAEWKLGNLREQSLTDIASSPRRQEFARQKGELDKRCQQCKWLPLCRGGCQRDRLYPSGTNPERYFCAAYQKFFAHSEQAFQKLALAGKTQTI